MYNLLADLSLFVHVAYIVFVLFGGLLLLRWYRLAWLHLPALTWAVFVELSGWVCPLTPLENYWRMLAGEEGYQGDFIVQYLLPLLYPAELTPKIQWALATVVIVINLVIYSLVIRKRKRTRQASQHSAR